MNIEASLDRPILATERYILLISSLSYSIEMDAKQRLETAAPEGSIVSVKPNTPPTK